MRKAQQEIAIWDNGALDDVRQLLLELGVEFGEGEAKDSAPLPTHLLISSGSNSVETLRRLRSGERTHYFMHLVIVERGSRSLAAALERQGCGIVVRAPIHPTSLRLLVQRALFSGENKRLVPRVAIGETVKLKTRLWSRDATLAELSVRGCGLIASQRFEIGDLVGLVLPATLSGDGPLSLEGTVVGIQKGLDAEGGRNCAALVFRKHSRAQAVAINKIMQRNAVGPTGKCEEEPGTPLETTTNARAKAGTSEATGTERRTAVRRSYKQAILARGDGAIYSLIGRDLSTGGMRVAHDANLRIGTRLRLAIYGPRGTEPVIVSAEVVRENGSSGIGLAFSRLEATAAARLEAIVASLPKLHQSNASCGVVVSEVLEST